MAWESSEEAFAEASRRIAEEAEKQTGKLDLSGRYNQPSLLCVLPEELASLIHLQHLDCSFTNVNSLEPLKYLTNLNTLVCKRTPVSDLSPLNAVHQLKFLDCSNTNVREVEAISGLSNLQTLCCSDTEVSDLVPLKSLNELRTLLVGNTKISTLEPLKALSQIKTLSITGTKVSDLSPIATLSQLEHLHLARTPVSNILPVKTLSQLKHLDFSTTAVGCFGIAKYLQNLEALNFSFTSIADLTKLKEHPSLITIHCSWSHINDLTPLATIRTLRVLGCMNTHVSNLSPLVELPNFYSLNISGCPVRAIPKDLIGKDSFKILNAHHCRMPGIPDGVLSSSFDANCLDSVRAHFADEARGTAAYGDVKLFLIGNGKAGKTQIARWLCGEEFEPRWDSTHGVRITTIAQPGSIASELGLQIWDFGGQDLYHSTHALFLSGAAIVMPVWALEQEDGVQADKHGYASRNQKLAYWLTVARHQFRAENPVLIAQTKIAGLAPSRQRLPAEAEAVLDNFSEEHFVRCLHLDSLTREQEGTLRGALTDAIKWLRDPSRLGMPSIGIGRLRVLRELEQMRAEDAKRQSAQRQHRTLGLVEFEAICAQGDDISSSEELLKFLDRIGAAIYRSGYFDDRIVLDFDWLLQGIYTVFDRKNVYPDIQRHSGRFTLGDLARLAWQDRSPEEQKLLLDMMLSCGICFRHRRYWGTNEDRTEYVAPDLLPERSAYAELLAAHWEDDRPTSPSSFITHSCMTG